MAFTAADVKTLREMTGVGMMDCKKALTASDGDMDKAVEFLREKGLAASAKKAGRVAAEGMAYAAVGSLYQQALYSIALVLFLFIMLINVVLNRFIKKRRED